MDLPLSAMQKVIYLITAFNDTTELCFRRRYIRFEVIGKCMLWHRAATLGSPLTWAKPTNHNASNAKGS